MKKIIGLSFVLMIGFSACAPRIANTWTISNYQINEGDQQKLSASNVGTIEFMKNQTGVKNIDFSVLDNNVTDKTPFTWTAQGKYITIKSDQSNLSKTWIVTSDKRNKQVLESTDGNNRVQILELRR